jgi:hypothetical protein
MGIVKSNKFKLAFLIAAASILSTNAKAEIKDYPQFLCVVRVQAAGASQALVKGSAVSEANYTALTVDDLRFAVIFSQDSAQVAIQTTENGASGSVLNAHVAIAAPGKLKSGVIYKKSVLGSIYSLDCDPLN